MVYFILNERTGLIKIGHSSSPHARLKKLQTASADPLRLIGVIPGAEQEEAFLHKRFGRQWEGGEWFAIERRTVDEIVEIGWYVASRERQERLPLAPSLVDPSALEVIPTLEVIPSLETFTFTVFVSMAEAYTFMAFAHAGRRAA